jgi:hypothetical protein
VSLVESIGSLQQQYLHMQDQLKAQVVAAAEQRNAGACTDIRLQQLSDDSSSRFTGQANRITRLETHASTLAAQQAQAAAMVERRSVELQAFQTAHLIGVDSQAAAQRELAEQQAEAARQMQTQQAELAAQLQAKQDAMEAAYEEKQKQMDAEQAVQAAKQAEAAQQMQAKQAELAKELQEQQAAMAAAHEEKQKQMDAEFAQRQKAQITRISESVKGLIGGDADSVLAYRFNKWKVAVEEAKADKEEAAAEAAHAQKMAAEKAAMQAAMDAKQAEMEKLLQAQQEEHAQTLASQQAQVAAEAERRSAELQAAQAAQQAEMMAQPMQLELTGLPMQLAPRWGHVAGGTDLLFCSLKFSPLLAAVRLLDVL